MRLRLLWATATMLPMASDSTAKMTSICCQMGASSMVASPSRRNSSAKAPSLGPAATSSVAAVGAPWYTSGTHMWNGTAPSLKARPATRNTTPKASTCCEAMPL